jgi:hypothetical protein
MSMMGNRRAADVSDQEIIQVYLAGNSAAATARLTGISETTIYRVLEANGVPRVRMTEVYERRARFHAAKAREIRAEYEAGTAFADLVRKHGGTEYSIKRAIKSAGGSLVPVTPPLSEQDRKTILGLAKDGLSQMKISLQLGRSQSTVRRFLASQGIAHRKAKGAAHGRWKGGRIIAGGYARVLVAHDDPMASMRFSDGYVPEHRLVMARALGRPLLRTETVHHINGDKTDNRLENLQLRHGKHGKNVVLCCRDCGSQNIGPAPIADSVQ